MLNKNILDISTETVCEVEKQPFYHAFFVFCQQLMFTSPIEVSLMFIDSIAMQHLNKKYRGSDNTTDVLSFPADGLLSTTLVDKDETRFLGEILIDINYVKEHAANYQSGQPLIEVFVHGLLHLAGYDHLNTQQRNEMQNMEHEILDIIRREHSDE